MLKADSSMFCLTLEYVGKVDPKVPRAGLTLYTKAIPRTVPASHSDFVIIEAQALQIIAWLESDGFLGRATEGAAEPIAHDGYVLRVSGGGITLVEPLGWDLRTYRRMQSLAAAVADFAQRPIKKVLDSVADVFGPLDAADRVDRLNADLAKRLKDNVDSFALRLQRRSPGAAEMNDLLLAVEPSELYTPVPRLLYAFIEKESAIRIVDDMAKSGVLGRAVDAPPVARVAPAGSLSVRYAAILYGKGLAIETDLGGDDSLLDALQALRAPLSRDAAVKMDRIITGVRQELAKARQAKEGQAKAVETAKEDRAKQVAERREKIRASASTYAFQFMLTLQGDRSAARFPAKVPTNPDHDSGSHCDLRLKTEPLQPGQAGYWHSIDEPGAGRLVERLEKDGFFAADAGREAFEGNTPHYVLTVIAGEVKFVENIGWGPSMLKRLESIRTVLEGRAAENMDEVLALVRAIPPPSEPAPPPRRETAKETPRPSRAAMLKSDLDHFRLFLEPQGAAIGSYPRFALSVAPGEQTGGKETPVDKDTAGRLIDYLAERGILDRTPPSAPPPATRSIAQPVPGVPGMPGLRGGPVPSPRPVRSPPPAPVPPASVAGAPSYRLTVTCGSIVASGMLRPDQNDFDMLVGIRDLLGTEAGGKFDEFMEPIRQFAGLEAAKAREARARAGEDRRDKVLSDPRGLGVSIECIGADGTIERRLTLSACPFRCLASPSSAWVVVEPAGVARVIERLADEGFFNRAEEKIDVTPGRRTWVLSVAGVIVLRENVGGDEELKERLKPLLPLLEGDAAGEVAAVLAGLKG